MANTVLTEVFVNSTWTDISHNVRNSGAVTATFGLPNEAANVNPVNMQLVLNNGVGDFSPDNPAGQYWPTFGRNTGIRVTLNGSRRFTGEIASATVSWDVSGKDIITTISAGGVLRRTNQGTPPVLSPSRRFITRLPGGNGVYGGGQYDVLAWFPLEDKSGTAPGGAETIGTGAVTSNQLDTTTSTVAYGDTTGTPPGTPSTLRMTQGGTLVARFNAAPIVDVSTLTAYSVSLVAKLDIGTSYAIFVHPRFMNIGPTFPSGIDPTLYLKLILGLNGTAELGFNNAAGSGVTTVANVTVDGDNGIVTNSIGFGGWPRQKWHHYLMSFEQITGGNFRAKLWVDGVSVIDSGFTNTPFTVPDTVTITSVIGIPSADPHSISIGHLLVRAGSPSGWPAGTIAGLANACLGSVGEVAATRLSRLCSEENIPFALTGSAADTVTMGPQAQAAIPTLLQACVDADLGILYESPGALGLTYVTRKSLYNQNPTVTVDYSLNQLSPPFTPISDDKLTINDVFVTRAASSVITEVKALTGTLAAIPVSSGGVGVYPKAITVNVLNETNAASVAGWLVSLGTVTQTRYPKLTFELARTALAALLTALRSVVVGNVIRIINPKIKQAPGPINLIVQGYTERYDRFLHTITFVTAPAVPYTVINVDSAGLMKVDASNSVIIGGPWAAASTTFTVVASGVTADQWVTGAVSFDVLILGERMTVTNISGSGTQTFTVTRAVNGIAKILTNGAAVVLAVPYHVAY